MLQCLNNNFLCNNINILLQLLIIDIRIKIKIRIRIRIKRKHNVIINRDFYKGLKHNKAT